jgi:DNA-directed RNA polymerase specialized sigma24 family protein
MATVTANPDRVRTTEAWITAGSPDDVLVAALRRRDENAYLELVRRHTPLMVRVARSVLGSTEAAEDAVQDTWVAVLRSVDGFQGRSTFKTWLMRILVNTARSRKVREARTVCWSTSAGDTPVWDAVLARTFPQPAGPLDGELDAHSALFDAAARHVGVDGMTQREIAATINDGIQYGAQRPCRLADSTRRQRQLSLIDADGRRLALSRIWREASVWHRW